MSPFDPRKLRPHVPLLQRRHAGARRVTAMHQLADHLAELTPQEFEMARRMMNLPPIAGGGQNVIFGTANASALTTAQVTFLGPLLGIPQAPIVLCLAYIPQITTVTAAGTITLQMRRTDTPAVISNAVKLAATTDTNPGPFTIMGCLPMPSTTTTAVQLPAGYGIDVQGAATSGSPVPAGSATAPMILGAFGIN